MEPSLDEEPLACSLLEAALNCAVVGEQDLYVCAQRDLLRRFSKGDVVHGPSWCLSSAQTIIS